jgi:translation elongation factor EF-1alpha
VQVQTIFCDETEVGAAKGGENLRLRLSGIDEDDVQAGFVVCDPHVVVPVVTYFEAQLQVCIAWSRACMAVRLGKQLGVVVRPADNSKGFSIVAFCTAVTPQLLGCLGLP